MTTEWWVALETALTGILPELADGDVLVLTADGDGPFIQFVQQSDRLMAEAADLAGAGAGLRALGWYEPQPAVDRPNWWTDLAWPLRTADYQRVAGMTVAGFRDVYRVAPAALGYRSWSLAREKHLRWELLDRLPVASASAR